MMNEQELASIRKTLSQLVGRSMSSVEFVRDYIQLRFDGPTVTVLTRLAVVTQSRRLDQTDPGFRDALCEQIGKSVSTTDVTAGERLKIAFLDGSQIHVSLSQQDYVGAEGVVYESGRKVFWAL
ncbi:MAG: hypothetical protein L6Q99_21680 [Planctomycetes bacterium]|nr:hypothetical protein [Planctomycetota bacterium]